MKRILTACLLAVWLAACVAAPTPVPPAEHEAKVATAWFDLYHYLVRDTPGFSPPVAARAFGYAGVTLYESVVPGMPDHRSLAGQLNGLTELPLPEAGQSYHWPTAANAALSAITQRLFVNTTGQNMAAVYALETRLNDQYRPVLAPEIFERSVAFGRAVAEAVYEWSRTDGADQADIHNVDKNYVPPAGPGLWSPTPPKFLPALQPYWGNNRPFVLASGAECNPGPPPPYSEDPASPFYAEAMEVYDSVNDLTPEERDMVLFWADDAALTATPPGHSISIATMVLKERGASLALAAETYARVGLAVNDAFISAWHTKYDYNLMRPVTYIQKVIDPNWLPPDLSTPPFPEYTSGHSVQSGAAAQVLIKLFGETVTLTDTTHADRGFAPRIFNTFAAFADEAAMSRLYGGIHFRSAIDKGLEQGRCVGQRVNSVRWGGE